MTIKLGVWDTCYDRATCSKMTKKQNKQPTTEIVPKLKYITVKSKCETQQKSVLEQASLPYTSYRSKDIHVNELCQKSIALSSKYKRFQPPHTLKIYHTWIFF